MPHAVITGGSSGIGKAIAQRLWQQGYSLTLLARQEKTLVQVQRDLRAANPTATQQAEIISVDVSQERLLRAAIDECAQLVGPIELLINCAGICTPGHFLEQPVKVAEETMATNFFGSLYASHAVLPMMVERKKGHLVFVSSGVGLIGLYGYSSYSPSKFAVRGLAESLRLEMKPHGVHISIVYPPDTDTPQLARENKVKPTVTRKLSEAAQLLSADQVANAIVRGVQSQKFLITPGLEMTVLGRLHSLITPLLNRYFDGIIAKTLAQKNESHP